MNASQARDQSDRDPRIDESGNTDPRTTAYPFCGNRATIRRVLTVLATVACAACGGGGSGGGTPPPTPTPVTYTGAATPGELVTYTLDTSSLTYSYTIAESEYGLAGHTGSGSLTAEGNGVYALSGIDGGKAIAVVLPSGLMVAVIHDTFNGVTKTVPVIGVSNPVTSLASLAASYNTVSRRCPTTDCHQTVAPTDFGTFVVTSNGAWTHCSQADYATNPTACVGGAVSGTLTDLGGGRFHVYSASGTLLGTLLALTAPNGQNVLLIDIHDPGYFGYGIFVGAAQTVLAASDVAGTWRDLIAGKVETSVGFCPFHGSETLTVSNADTVALSNGYLVSDVCGGTISLPTGTNSIALNSPWNGFVLGANQTVPWLLTGASVGIRATSCSAISSTCTAPQDILRIALKL